MKHAFENEFRIVAAVAVLLVAISVLAVIASRTEPDARNYQGVSPAAPIAKPVPAPTTARTAP